MDKSDEHALDDSGERPSAGREKLLKFFAHLSHIERLPKKNSLLVYQREVKQELTSC